MDTLREFLKPQYLWLLIGLGLLFLEMLIPGVVILFFGIGALLVGVLCFFIPMPLSLQLLVFMASSLLFLFALRKWAKLIFVGREGDDGKDVNSALIGTRAVVKVGAPAGRRARVELNGTEWTAEAETDLEEGQVVHVTGQDSLTLQVEAG